jgi:hypothetical protein
MTIILINLLFLFGILVTIFFVGLALYDVLFFRKVRNNPSYHGNFLLALFFLIGISVVLPILLFLFISAAVFCYGYDEFIIVGGSRAFVPITKDILEQTKVFLSAKELYDNNLLITNQMFISDVLIYRTALSSLLNLPLFNAEPHFIDTCLQTYNTCYLLLFKNHYLTQSFCTIWIKIWGIRAGYYGVAIHGLPLEKNDALMFFFKYAEIIVNPQYYEAYLTFCLLYD